jgi:hypothetical protein
VKNSNFAKSFLLASLLVAGGCGRTPQMGGDRQCMTAADALWTAVNVKEPEFLDRAEAEIQRLHAAGRMPQDAFDSLSSIIATARAGQWSDARATLKQFIRDQRTRQATVAIDRVR